MNRLWRRVTFGKDGPSVGPARMPASVLVGRLEAGETWAAILSETGLSAADLVAAVAADALGDEDSPGLTLIQSPPRRPKLEPALAATALPGTATSPVKHALAAGLLQVADFWDASHVAAQEADDLGERDYSPYWHGIAHRREPDPDNARYWFRWVGQNPLFDPLGQAAGRIEGNPFRGGIWDPMVMIDIAGDSRQEVTARRLQRLELISLLEATAEAAGIS